MDYKLYYSKYKGSEVDAAIDEIPNKLDKSVKGVANGVASLGADGKVPESQLPQISSGKVDTVSVNSGTPIQPDTNKNINIEISKSTVGLGNVDNTSDADKPISTAQQKEFDKKFDKTGGSINGSISVTGTAEISGDVNVNGNLFLNDADAKIQVAGIDFSFPNKGGTIATTNNIPDMSSFAKQNAQNTFTEENSFNNTVFIDDAQKTGVIIVNGGALCVRAEDEPANLTEYKSTGIYHEHFENSKQIGGTYTFPEKSGVLALTSDIPDTSDFVKKSSDNIFTGINTFNSDIEVSGSLTLTETGKLKKKNEEYTFPEKSGTLALTSDIPDTSKFVTESGNNTFTGNNSFSKDVTIDAAALSVVSTGLITSLYSDSIQHQYQNDSGTNITETLNIPQKGNGTFTLATTDDIPDTSKFVTSDGDNVLTGNNTFKVDSLLTPSSSSYGPTSTDELIITRTNPTPGKEFLSLGFIFDNNNQKPAFKAQASSNSKQSVFTFPTEKDASTYTLATTDDIPDTSKFVTTAGDNSFTGTNTFAKNVTIENSSSIDYDEGFKISYPQVSASTEYRHLSIVSTDPTTGELKYHLPSKSGIFALKDDIPDTSSFAKLTEANEFTAVNTFATYNTETNKKVFETKVQGKSVVIEALDDDGNTTRTATFGLNGPVITDTTNDKQTQYRSDDIRKIDTSNSEATIIETYKLPSKGVTGSYTLATTDDITANPTLSGSEAALTGISINGTSYKVEGGSGSDEIIVIEKTITSFPTASSPTVSITFTTAEQNTIKNSIERVILKISTSNTSRILYPCMGSTIIWDFASGIDANVYYTLSLTGGTGVFTYNHKMTVPVGNIYLSTSSTSPAGTFGGTWERIKDKFLLAAGDTYSAGATGGSADAVAVSHTHTAETIGTGSGGVQADGTTIQRGYAGTYQKTAYAERVVISTAGVSGTGKNMPPYIAVYVWKRVS